MKRLSATLALLFYFSILPPLGSTAPVIKDLIVKESPYVDVRAYLPAGYVTDGSVDYSAQFQTAVDNVRTTGGTILVPINLRFHSPIDMTNISKTVKIVGLGKRTTTISAVHTGHAFDLTGSSFIEFHDIAVSGNGSTMPKTAFLLARNSTGNSAGGHRFYDVFTTGYFSVAALYSYGSEELRMFNCNFVNNHPNTKGVVVLARSNVSGLTSTFATIATGGQSNTEYLFDGTAVSNYAATGTTNVAYYIEGVSALAIRNGFTANTAALAVVYIDASSVSSNNISIQGGMWDAVGTTYGVAVVGATAVAHITVSDLYEGGVKTYANGGRTFYVGSGANVSNLNWRNVYRSDGANIYTDTLATLSHSNISLGASDNVIAVYEFTKNSIIADKTRLSFTRADLSIKNQIFDIATGEYSNFLDCTAFTWEPGAITTDNGVTSGQIPITNADFGQFYTVAPPYDMQGTTAFAYVESAGVVKIRVNNLTDNTVTLAEGIWKVKGLR